MGREPQEMDKISIQQVMPGAEVLSAGGEQIAIGFPEEVVKAWMVAGASPTAWLIPDVRTSGSVVQWALEFPLYFALFVQGKFARREKVRVLVHQRDWPDVVEYLRLTLLGLTRDELTKLGLPAERIEQMCAEGEHLALKTEAGEVAQMEDFLEPIFFDAEGSAELSGVRIRSHGDNTWSFFVDQDRLEEHRLEIDAEQAPPWTEPLPPADAPVLPQPFEIIALGTTSGFDPTGPCTSLLAQAHGRFMLIDCGPYVRVLLEHAGVSPDQLEGLVITHAHEDHAIGLSALLDATRRIKLFASRETAAILGRKLAILNPDVASPDSLLTDAFEVVEVSPDAPVDYLGLTLKFHYTMHAIPCTGVELSLADGAATRRVLVVGDHNARAKVEQAAEAGVIGPERLATLTSLYQWRGDLLIADAGAGPIHGLAADFHDNPSDAIACIHTGALADAERHLYSLARPGHRWTIAPEASRPSPLERGLGYRALVEAFEETGPDRLNALLDAAAPVSANRGQVVVRRGDPTRDLFIALTGELAVVVERADGPAEVARIRAGEVFGEMAVVCSAPRSASVVAATAARLLRVPAEAFGRFVQASELGSRLPGMWDKRAALERAGVLAEASVTVRNRIARCAVRKLISPGATLIREGSRSNTVFVLVAGRVQVYRGTEPLMADGAPVIVGPGSLLGETAPFLRQARNASIVSVDECEVLAIKGADFKRIVQESPHLFFQISRVVAKRRAA